MRRAHTTLNLLPNRGFPAGTRKTQLVTCMETGSTGNAGLVPSHGAQVYHEMAFVAIGSRMAAPSSTVVFLHAPPRASSARLKPAVSARRFL
jgi:hypothetical protein